MRYLESGRLEEIGSTNKQKYMAYENQYIPFLAKLKTVEADQRKVDKALFSFGKFLKFAAKYV
jgi:hypothetical protein